MRASQRVPGGAFGVERIGFGPRPSRRALGPVEFDDQFIGVSEVAGQAGAIAAGAEMAGL